MKVCDGLCFSFSSFFDFVFLKHAPRAREYTRYTQSSTNGLSVFCWLALRGCLEHFDYFASFSRAAFLTICAASREALRLEHSCCGSSAAANHQDHGPIRELKNVEKAHQASRRLASKRAGRRPLSRKAATSGSASMRPGAEGNPSPTSGAEQVIV